MEIRFPYELKPSAIFDKVMRPVAKVKIFSPKFQEWLTYTFIVDTGADYTLLPKHYSLSFGINLNTDCQKLSSQGIGGVETIYFFKEGFKFKIDKWEKSVPLGFLNRDDVPPLLGRKGCLDELHICFKNFETVISLK